MKLLKQKSTRNKQPQRLKSTKPNKLNMQLDIRLLLHHPLPLQHQLNPLQHQLLLLQQSQPLLHHLRLITSLRKKSMQLMRPVKPQSMQLTKLARLKSTSSMKLDMPLITLSITQLPLLLLLTMMMRTLKWMMIVT